jgi:hypothetical protein
VERINVKKAQKPFCDRLSANTFDILCGTFGTEWTIHSCLPILACIVF